MRIIAYRCSLVISFIGMVIFSSHSKDQFNAQIKDHPRHFEVSGKGYILSDREPGIIEDEKALYTNDAGARTFNFQEKTILTHGYVGKWKNFDSLSRDEHEEIKNIARGALDFISRLEQRQRSLSAVDSHHQEILKTFLANDQ